MARLIKQPKLAFVLLIWIDWQSKGQLPTDMLPGILASTTGKASQSMQDYAAWGDWLLWKINQ